MRIEETLAVDDVVRQLCISVKIKDPPAMYALRDEHDELVTNENLRKKVKAKVPLRCVQLTAIHFDRCFNESGGKVRVFDAY